jgi:hypothetical protein
MVHEKGQSHHIREHDTEMHSTRSSTVAYIGRQHLPVDAELEVLNVEREVHCAVVAASTTEYSCPEYPWCITE